MSWTLGANTYVLLIPTSAKRLGQARAAAFPSYCLFVFLVVRLCCLFLVYINCLFVLAAFPQTLPSEISGICGNSLEHDTACLTCSVSLSAEPGSERPSHQTGPTTGFQASRGFQKQTWRFRRDVQQRRGHGRRYGAALLSLCASPDAPGAEGGGTICCLCITCCLSFSLFFVEGQTIRSPLEPFGEEAGGLIVGVGAWAYIHVYNIYIYIYIYIYVYLSISLSLSLSIYLYIYI